MQLNPDANPRHAQQSPHTESLTTPNNPVIPAKAGIQTMRKSIPKPKALPRPKA